jgi:PAS domain S-box-containing protein
VSDSEARLLRAVIRETPLVIYAKDLDGRFVLSNRMHCSLLGRTAEEVLGRTDSDLFGGAAAEVEATTERVLTERAAVASEYTLPISGEQRTYLETIFPLHDAAGLVGVGGIATDITARRSLEGALQERATQLEQALADLEIAHAELLQQEKLAALGALVAAVAHEVNTPVGVALTSTSLVEDVLERLRGQAERGELTRGGLRAGLEQGIEAARLASQALHRAGKLIRSFRQVAVDRSTPELRTVRLAEWLAELEESLRPLARHSAVTLQLEAVNDAPLVLAAGDLQQVITNLVVNAFVHAFTDLPLDVDRRVSLTVKVTDTNLHIAVVDNGVGMSADIVSRATEPFFTTRRGLGGSGLGLHIVQTIVAGTFRGVLCIDSEPGRGTTVHLRLPLGSEALTLAAR